jgi:hypothetical protein
MQFRKLLMCFGIYVLIALSYKIVLATEANATNEAVRVENYIATLYKQLDFNNRERLSYVVFNKAMHGYMNLKNAGRLNDEKEILTICDFNQPSTLDRMWVIDLVERKILFNTYVAHGQATGEDCAMAFSNKGCANHPANQAFTAGKGSSSCLMGTPTKFLISKTSPFFLMKFQI